MGRMELMGYWRQHAGASGGSGVSAPGFDLSVQINIHERTDLSRPSSLEYIGGAAAGGSVGLGLIGGYSRSVQIQNGSIKKAPGFHTNSAGIGAGGGIPLGARTSISKTGYYSLNFLNHEIFIKFYMGTCALGLW
ncbi:MAG: hypothetical protein IPL13_16585 [Saprospiraceae bacterium]|nr:hypothetical protein [Candidatus Brachybacter algidus]